MTNTKYNRKPFEGTFNNLVDDLFTDFPAFFKQEFNNSVHKGKVPANVKELEKSYVLELVVPGFEKTDFSINLDQQILTVSGERNAQAEVEGQKTIRNEYTVQAFKRSFTLDEKIDATNIDASYINGILTISLPKKEEVKAQATSIVVK